MPTEARPGQETGNNEDEEIRKFKERLAEKDKDAPKTSAGAEVVNLANGDTYQGDMRNGRPHGKGEPAPPCKGASQTVSIRPYASIKNSHFALGRAGVYTWSDGSTYSGDWFEGMKHGRGLYVYANGDVYEGGYYNGVKHGYGAAAWSNGSRYEGNWDSGREHGQGKYQTATGQCYTGTFNQGFVDGEGMHTWADGSTFYCLHSMGAAVSQGHYVASEPAQPDLQTSVVARSYTPMAPTYTTMPVPAHDPGLVQMPNGQVGYIIPVALSPRAQAPPAQAPLSNALYASRESRPKSREGRKSKSRSLSGGRRKSDKIVTNPYGPASQTVAGTVQARSSPKPTTNPYGPFTETSGRLKSPAPNSMLLQQAMPPPHLLGNSGR